MINFKIKDINFSVKYSSGGEYQQFYIKNNNNNRYSTSKYTNDDKLYEDKIIPSMFDQKILLLSTLNVNKITTFDYIFCDYQFAEIIHKIYISRTNDIYNENFKLNMDSKGEFLNIKDEDIIIKLNSITSIKDFYIRRTPNFTFSDFTKAIDEYKKINVRNNTALYNYLITVNIREDDFIKLLDRLRLKAILEFSIWRTKLEDYKKKTRDSKGDIIVKDPINFFKLILNPFNLEELVEIGINYSERYKDLLEDKYTLLRYSGEDYKKGKYLYSDEENDTISKIETIIKLGNKFDLDLEKLKIDYENKLKGIELKFKILPEKERLLNILNNFEEYEELDKFKEDWKLFIQLNEDKLIDKTKLNNLVYENITLNKLIIDKIKDKIRELNSIDYVKSMLSEELQKLHQRLSNIYKKLLEEYEVIYKYYRNLEINNKRLIKNINIQLEENIKRILSNVNNDRLILVELNDGVGKRLDLDELLTIKIDTIRKITLPKLSGDNVELFINPFTYDVKNKPISCNISSFGNLGSIINNKDSCFIRTLFPIGNYKRSYLDGNLIITKVITKSITKSRDSRKDRIEIDMEGGGRKDRIQREMFFNLNPNDERVEIKLDNILGMIIRLNYSSYLIKKYSSNNRRLDLSTRLEFIQELNIINRILENSNIPKIQIIEDDITDNEILETPAKKVTMIRDEYIYPELSNTLRILEDHPRYLEIAFFLEMYFKYSKREYKNNWLEELIEQKVLNISELDKLRFNVKLKFSKKEFIYNSVNFVDFIKNLNEYIDIKIFISNNIKLLNKLEEMILIEKVSKYEFYQELKSLTINIKINGDINIDNITKISNILRKIINEETSDISIEELQHVEELINNISMNLRDYNYIEEIRELFKIINKFNKFIKIIKENKKEMDTSLIDRSDRSDRFDGADTRSRKKGKIYTTPSDRKKALIKSLDEIDFITVFQITKHNDKKLKYNLLSENIQVIEEDYEEEEIDMGLVSFEFKERQSLKPVEEQDVSDVDNLDQLGGDRKYLDRTFYLLRNEFYQDRLTEIYNNIPNNLKKYQPLTLPDIINIPNVNTLKIYFKRILEFYERLKKIYNSGIEKLKEDLKEIKNLITIQVKNLNPYENEFNSDNFDKIQKLEYQKMSFPFEIVYIYNNLDLKDSSFEFLEQITKELINFVRSKNKQNIYREKSIEYKILNNLSYDYSLILKETDTRIKLSLDIPKISYTEIHTENNKLKQYRENKKELLTLQYLREDEAGGLGSRLDVLVDEISKIKDEFILANKSDIINDIDKEILQQVFKELLRNIDSKINQIILDKIRINDTTDIFNNEDIYNNYIRNLQSIITELNRFNIEKKSPSIIIDELIKRNLLRLQKTQQSNIVLDNLFKIYQIEIEKQEPDIRQDILPPSILPPSILPLGILPYNPRECKDTINIKINNDILDLLSDKYKLMPREKLTIISEGKYNELEIVKQYQDNKNIYLVVNDGINNIPKYKQNKKSKIDEKIIELSEDEKQEINKLILVYSLLSGNLIIPFKYLVNKRGRIMRKIDEYVLCNKVKLPSKEIPSKEVDKRKLFISNIVILLLENFLNTDWGTNLPVYLGLSKKLKDKYENKVINTKNIFAELLKLLNLIEDKIYKNIPDKLDDKYFIQFNGINNVKKYNFEWFLLYYVDVMKLQLLRDNNITVNLNNILLEFIKMIRNKDFENNLNTLNKVVELLNKKNNIIKNLYKFNDIINGLQGDVRIKNLKGKQQQKKNQYIDKLKRELVNKEELRIVILLEEEFNNIIDNIFENYDTDITFNENLNRLDIIINELEKIPAIELNKDTIIKQILAL